MYSVYISDYEKDGAIVSTPFLIYDTQSPSNDILLSDPIVDLEDSKAGSFSFIMPSSHVAYDWFKKKKTLVTVKRDDEKIIFEGLVTSANRDLYKSKSIFCEGFPTFLNDVAQPRKEYFDISLEDYVKALLKVHNDKYATPDRKFSFTWDPNNAPKFPENEIKEKLKTMKDFLKPSEERNSEDSPYECTQYKSTMYYLQELQSRCKGHFIFTINEDQSYAKYNLAYVKELPNGTQDIWFGNNLLDYTDSYDSSNLCTAVLPIASIGNYGTSKVGKTVAVMPEEGFVFGDVSAFELFTKDNSEYTDTAGVRTYTKIHVDDGQNVFVLNNTTHKIYTVRYAGDDISVDEIYSGIIPRWSCVLGHKTDAVLQEAVPINLTKDEYYNPSIPDHNVWVFKCKQFFPTTGTANMYYMSAEEMITISNYTVHRTQFWNGSDYQDTGYYDNIQDQEHNIANNVSSTFPYHVLEYVPSVEDEQLYISARSVCQDLKSGYNTKYIYAVWFNYNVGYLLTQKTMSNPNGNCGEWNTVIDECIDISNTANGAECYGANSIFVAAWGKSVEITIKQQDYSYKTPDYTIGEIISPRTGGVREKSYILYNDGTISVYTDPSLTGYTVYEYDLKALDCKKLYLSARINNIVNQTTPTVEKNLFWCVRLAGVDGNNVPNGMVIDYGEPNQDGMTSIINKVFDLESPELKDGGILQVSSFGSVIPIVAREYIEQSGSMTDYMTVEGVDDYYYQRYALHVDEKVHEKGFPYVESTTLANIYGRIERTVEFNNVGSPDILVERAADYLFNAQYDDLTFTLTGIDMHNLDLNIEAFDISTNVKIVSPPHGIDGKYIPIKSLKINLQNPTENEISLGDSDTLAERMNEAVEGSDTNV